MHDCTFKKAEDDVLREDEALLIFDLLYYHRSHIYWKFHWNSSIRSEDMKIYFLDINRFY